MTNLTLDEKKALIRMALEAREQAYAPYSDFMVGAGPAGRGWPHLHRLQCGELCLYPHPAALSVRPCSRR